MRGILIIIIITAAAAATTTMILPVFRSGEVVLVVVVLVVVPGQGMGLQRQGQWWWAMVLPGGRRVDGRRGSRGCYEGKGDCPGGWRRRTSNE